MRVLLIDALGLMTDFAMRCEASGHEVRVFIPKEKDGSSTRVGEGLCKRVADWQLSMDWADFIMVSDNAMYIRQLEAYRNRGYPIFGPSVATTAWELDRGIGQRVLEAAGIETIPSVTFTDYNSAMAYVRSSQKRYVSKPSGDADKALSYVSKSPADMLYMLEYWKSCGKLKQPFLLQEFIPGIEMAVGGWFGRNGFEPWFLENFEFKKLMVGEVGVNTGEMGTAMRYVSAEQSKLAREMLLPLEGELYREGYTGYVDVAVIVDKQGQPWPLEFTCRPGWPLFNIQQVLHPEVVEWMLACCTGTGSCFTPSEEIGLGVVMAIPPFPSFTANKLVSDGFPVWGITDKNRYYVHPCYMRAGSGPMMDSGELKENQPLMVTAGNYVLVTSGTGGSVSEAKAHAYKVLDEIEIPYSPMYRLDIGDRLEKQLPELQKHGYAEAWEF